MAKVRSSEASLPSQASQDPKKALKEFVPVAKTMLAEAGIGLKEYSIRSWRSVEDPTFTQIVLDLKVNASPDQALDAWECLSEKLRDFLLKTPGRYPDVLDKVAIEVAWR